MRRGLLIVTVAAGWALAAPTPAQGGGGCHREAQTQAKGTTVELAQNCMNPTVLRTDPNTIVTFVNRDEIMHNVVGDRWGTAELPAGGSTTNRFDTAGIYPFSCTFHPGMIGAVVVGDGLATGPATEVAKPRPVAASNPSRDSGGEGMPLGLALGAAAGAAATLGGVRLRGARIR